MTGLDKIRESMTEFLVTQGLTAITAWPAEEKKRWDEPVVAVSVRACDGGPGGFQDYLGERYDEASGSWQELYGRKVRVVFGLDVYAPGESGAGGCQAAFDHLAGALSGAGPDGLRVKEISRGEVRFDQALGLFVCPAEAVCEAYLYAMAEEGGAFLDFVVKGEGKWN